MARIVLNMDLNQSTEKQYSALGSFASTSVSSKAFQDVLFYLLLIGFLEYFVLKLILVLIKRWFNRFVKVPQNFCIREAGVFYFLHFLWKDSFVMKLRVSLSQGCGVGSPVIWLRLRAISIIRLRLQLRLRLRTDSNLQLY